MAVLERSALLRFPAESMYRLVGDIEAYPHFLPGCTSATVEAAEGNRVRARLGFKIRGLSDSFVTENDCEHSNRISMRLVEGPFRQLSGTWEFRALSEDACKVTLRLSLEIGNRMLEATLNPWLDRAVNGMIDAFRDRAERLYGSA